MAAGGRIGDIHAEGGFAPSAFPQVGTVVITHAVVQRETAGDFPGVLKIKRCLALLVSVVGRRIDADVAHRTRQETGELKAAAARRNR